MSRKGSLPRRPGPAGRSARPQGTASCGGGIRRGQQRHRQGGLHRDSAVLTPGRGGLATAIGSPLSCEQAHQEAVAVLSHGDLNVSIGGDSQQSLSDRDRLLIRIETNFKDLLRSFELSDQALELARLLFAFAGGGTQLARRLASFVHESWIGLPNCDHLFLASAWQQSRSRVIPTTGHRLYASGVV